MTERRTERIAVYFSSDERALLTTLAEKAGYRSIARFIRETSTRDIAALNNAVDQLFAAAQSRTCPICALNVVPPTLPPTLTADEKAFICEELHKRESDCSTKAKR